MLLQNILLVLSGCLTGFMLSAPVGPVNILCLEKSLSAGVSSGFFTGAGAALGDFIFVLAALGGFIAIGDIQEYNTNIIKYFGIIILCIFSLVSFIKGLKIFYQNGSDKTLYQVYFAKVQSQKNVSQAKKYQFIFSGFATSFLLTITNPLTPIGVVSAVASVGIGGNMLNNNINNTPSILFAFGVIIGSLGWWFSLSKIAFIFSKKLTARSLSLINYLGSFIMLLTASYLLFL